MANIVTVRRLLSRRNFISHKFSLQGYGRCFFLIAKKKKVKRGKKKTLQGDDGWFSSAHPRWPPTEKADGKGEIVNAQKIFLILWFLQFCICSIWNIYLSNKVLTRMSWLWGYWQPTELTFQSYRISKSCCTGFKFRVIPQGEQNLRSNEKIFWLNSKPPFVSLLPPKQTMQLFWRK